MSTTAIGAELAISLPEAAKRIGISRAGIWNLALGGALPTVKIGTRRLVRVEALEAWLAALESGPEGADTGSTPASAREGRRGRANARG